MPAFLVYIGDFWFFFKISLENIHLLGIIE